MEQSLDAKVTNYIANLKEQMCVSPDPSELPMPPQKWLKEEQESKYDLSLLDLATEQAIEVHWKNQVKACQYAIFHMC